MSAPAASVVVLNCNGRALLDACLRSLQAQTFQDFETIVVDNGSTDGSADWVRRHFPAARVRALPHNAGPCGGNNAGIALARGRYVAFVNNDTVLDPGWLGALVAALEAHPRAGFCASKAVLYDRPEILDTAGDHVSIAGAPGKIGHLDRADRPAYNVPKEVFAACTVAALYRREALAQAGGFDEDFSFNYEDVDLSFRVQLLGFSGCYAPDALVRHRLHGTLDAGSAEYDFYAHRNLEYVYLKNMPAGLLALTLPLHLIELLSALVAAALRGRAGAFFRGKRAALAQLPMLWRKRRQIQTRRRLGTVQLAARLRWDWPGLKLALWRRKRQIAREETAVFDR